MTGAPDAATVRLKELLAQAALPPLSPEQETGFATYLALLVRWNLRVNLTAIRDEETILSRHFVESIACAYALPADLQTLLDFGSGAGFPGIPIALCRPEIAITLAESQGKKAAFLSESTRILGLTAKVHSARGEGLRTVFDCVTLRAVDKMEMAVQAAVSLVRAGGWLALLTTKGDLDRLKDASGEEFAWLVPVTLPGSDERILALGQRVG